jgi:hypothetical protein
MSCGIVYPEKTKSSKFCIPPNRADEIKRHAPVRDRLGA